MNLLEFEAKKLLQKYSIPIPKGVLVQDSSHTLIPPTVLKSQVPVGGRGKAGGVRIVTDPTLLPSTISDMLTLSIKGHLPLRLLSEELLSIKREFYLALLVDRSLGTIQLMAHSLGGVEVESNDQDSYVTIDLLTTSSDVAGEQLAECYKTPEQTFALQELVKKLLVCFKENDATLLEINPLILTTAGDLVAGDCKMELDDAAAFRHPDWKFEAAPAEVNFVTLDESGAVATIANGAGLGMATVDAVAEYGLRPANFLDIGGGANTESILAAFQKITTYPAVQVIVINIFAGITRCDEVADAIIAARKQIANLPPLAIRLSGTNFEEAVATLAESGVTTFSSLERCLKHARDIIHG